MHTFTFMEAHLQKMKLSVEVVIRVLRHFFSFYQITDRTSKIELCLIYVF